MLCNYLVSSLWKGIWWFPDFCYYSNYLQTSIFAPLYLSSYRRKSYWIKKKKKKYVLNSEFCQIPLGEGCPLWVAEAVWNLWLKDRRMWTCRAPLCCPSGPWPTLPSSWFRPHWFRLVPPTARRAPTSEPFSLQLPLPRTLFPQTALWLIPPHLSPFTFLREPLPVK